MQINLTNPLTTSILHNLSTKLDLPIETVIELVLAWTDSYKVLAHGKQLSKELKSEVTECPVWSKMMPKTH